MYHQLASVGLTQARPNKKTEQTSILKIKNETGIQMIKSKEMMVLQRISPTLALNKMIAITCQCRDFPTKLCCTTIIHLFFFYYF